MSTENRSFHPKRILLKLSGERLAGPEGYGINASACHQAALSIQTIKKIVPEIAIVIGGGNLCRGINAKEMGLERTPADQIGMLATIMNGLALQNALNEIKCPARALSALDCPKVVESYQWQKANDYINSGEILIFVGGTGNPYFTTDTAAAMRASEIGAELLLKATKVDGVYSQDPIKFPNAQYYPEIPFSQVLAENLEVMDATAIALCMRNNIPVIVFDMQALAQNQMANILSGKSKRTLIH